LAWRYSAPWRQGVPDPGEMHRIAKGSVRATLLSWLACLQQPKKPPRRTLAATLATPLAPPATEAPRVTKEANHPMMPTWIPV